MASGSALAMDSELHSASEPAPESELDLVQVSVPASGFPLAPDSATYSAPLPEQLPPYLSPKVFADAGSAPCCPATE